MAEILAAIAVMLAIVAFLKSWTTAKRQEADARYLEWWMTSMENRKADRPGETADEYVDEPG